MKKSNFMLLLSCIYLILAPSFVFALPGSSENHVNHFSNKPSNSDWVTKSVERKGATSIYTAEKKVKDSIYVGKSVIKPTIAQVAKAIMRTGGGALVVSETLEALLHGVDYVMKLENNQAKFTTAEPVICYMMGEPCFSSESQARDYARKYFDDFWNGRAYDFEIKTKPNRDIHYIGIGTYSDTGLPDERVLPFYWANQTVTADEVASKVLERAEQGNARAMEFVGQIADAVSQAKKKADFEASKSLKTQNELSTQPEPSPQPDTSTGTQSNDKNKQNQNQDEAIDNPFNFPSFCEWGKSICDFVDWVKTEPNLKKEEPTKIDLEAPDIGDFRGSANANYVQSSSGCPADLTIPINWVGASTTLHISYTPFCHFASMIKPAVILGAWISGLMIVTGGRTKE